MAIARSEGPQSKRPCRHYNPSHVSVAKDALFESKRMGFSESVVFFGTNIFRRLHLSHKYLEQITLRVGDCCRQTVIPHIAYG